MIKTPQVFKVYLPKQGQTVMVPAKTATEAAIFVLQNLNRRTK